MDAIVNNGGAAILSTRSDSPRRRQRDDRASAIDNLSFLKIVSTFTNGHRSWLGTVNVHFRKGVRGSTCSTCAAAWCALRAEQWFATAWLAPAKNLTLALATNRGDSVAATAVDTAFEPLIQRYAQ